MIGRKQKAAARIVLLNAWQHYGNRAFKVDVVGSNYRPLKDAESLGWCTFIDCRCAILAAGVREIEPWRTDNRKPCTQWVCPVCQTVVSQYDDADGMPQKAHCPNCEAETIRAALAFRERHPA